MLKMATSIKCKAPWCDTTVAIARFNSHLMHHIAAHGSDQAHAQHGAGKQGTPKLDRPKIAQESSDETLNNLSQRCTTLTPDTAFYCVAKKNLGNHLVRIDPTAINGRDNVLMAANKRLPVTLVAIGVKRAELLQMKQSHGKGVCPFYAKVMGKANTCAYMVRS
jgi:hypothetical protein